MGQLHLTAFDLVAVAIVLISSIMAFARGLLREVFSIVALLGAAIAALYGHDYLAPYLQKVVGAPVLAHVAAGGIIALVVFIIITVATSTLAKALHKSGEIGAIDRAAGLAFGAVRGVLALALFVLLVQQISDAPQVDKNWLTSSQTYPALSQLADSMRILRPKLDEALQEHPTLVSSVKSHLSVGPASAPAADPNAASSAKPASSASAAKPAAKP